MHTCAHACQQTFSVLVIHYVAFTALIQLIKNFHWINQQCSSAVIPLLASNQKVTAVCIYTGPNGVKCSTLNVKHTYIQQQLFTHAANNNLNNKGYVGQEFWGTSEL